MKIFEIFGLARSGHHAVINWMIKNVCGQEAEMKWKLDLLDGRGVTYINEANLDTEVTLQYIKEQANNTKFLFLSYENCDLDFSILNTEKKYYFPTSLNLDSIKGFHYNRRIIILRNFYNNLASRLKANQENIILSREGTVLQWDVGQRFINFWKENAKNILNNKFYGIKYEDWLVDKNIRNEFLREVFGINEYYDNNVQGTHSSFGELKNLNERHKQIEIPDEVKELIKKDNELHFLIGKLGYEYIDI